MNVDKIDWFDGAYRWLSNFCPCTVKLEDETYLSTEAAYQAAKVTDKSLRKPFQTMSAPHAKKAGRALTLREDWGTIKESVMLDLLRQKFSQAYFAHLLRNTGGAELIESNTWHDVMWGRCLCKKHKGEGENKLGKLLMQVREEINK